MSWFEGMMAAIANALNTLMPGCVADRKAGMEPTKAVLDESPVKAKSVEVEVDKENEVAQDGGVRRYLQGLGGK